MNWGEVAHSKEADDPKENANQNSQPANACKKLPAPWKDFPQWFNVFAVRQAQTSQDRSRSWLATSDLSMCR
jgi:hypothetical protein